MLTRFTFAFLFLPMAFAHAQQFTSINCLDVNKANKAPVYYEMAGDRIELGNMVEFEGQTGRSATVYGNVESTMVNHDQAIIVGSFNTVLNVNLRTGQGKVTGQIKWDPMTGDKNIMDITDYAVNCSIQ